MEKVWVDHGYTGAGRSWFKEHRGWEVEVVSHPRRPRGMWVWPGMEITPEILAAFERPRGFRHLPCRWVVEKTQSQYPRDTFVDNTYATTSAWYQWTAAGAHLG